jgi:hypothetical protein
MSGLWKSLIFGFLAGALSSSVAIGPAAMLRLKENGVGRPVLLECVIAMGVASLILNAWMLSSRTVWTTPNRRQVVACVLLTYVAVAVFTTVFVFAFAQT